MNDENKETLKEIGYFILEVISIIGMLMAIKWLDISNELLGFILYITQATISIQTFRWLVKRGYQK